MENDPNENIVIGVPNGSPLCIPKCFRFVPTDDELVSQFLLRKCRSLPLLVDVVAEVDIYKFNPWELPEKSKYGETEWFFFTPRERKHPNSYRPNRSAGIGFWKSTGTDKKIGHPKVLGIKKSLVFHLGKNSNAKKTDWLMQEYCLPDVDRESKVNSSKLNEWVLVRVYHKKGTKEPFYLDDYMTGVKIGSPEANNDVISSPSTTMLSAIGSSNLGLEGIETEGEDNLDDSFMDQLMTSFPEVPDNIDKLVAYH